MPRLACALAAAGLLSLLLAAPASASPTGYWKLFVTIDYSSAGTATDTRCYPNREQTQPSTLTASASERIKVRTARPTLVDAHQSPNGVPVFGEYTTARGFRASVTATRESGLDASGDPFGCFPQYSQKPSCGSRSLRTGLFISPLGGIHSWRGFTVELQETPLGSFSRCPMTDAQNNLPEPFEIEVRTTPGKLTGHAPKLVFHDSQKLKASGREDTNHSTATGKANWTVKLVRSHP